MKFSLDELSKYTIQLHAANQNAYKPAWTLELVPPMLGKPTQVPVGVLGSTVAVAWSTIHRKQIQYIWKWVILCVRLEHDKANECFDKRSLVSVLFG